jgi:hypothetical protein
LDLLKTVPGVGQVTAVTWLSEVVDHKRFATSEQVAAYCGCDPSLKVSAGKVTDFVRRRGNLRLHKALLYAASSEMRNPVGTLAQWGQSIAGRHRKGGYRKATGALARRIACGLWHVQRLAKPFDTAQYRFGKPPSVRDAPASAIGLSPRHMSLLPEGMATAQAVVDAFWAGTLADVKGLGDGALKKISDWTQKNRVARAGPRTYLLNENLTYEDTREGRALPAGRGRGAQKEGSADRRQDPILRDPVRQVGGGDLPG